VLDPDMVRAYDVSTSDAMILAAQLVAMVAGEVNGEPGWGRIGLARMRAILVGSSRDLEATMPREDHHACRRPQVHRLS